VSAETGILAFLSARLADARPSEVCGCYDADHRPPCTPRPWAERRLREIAAKQAIVAAVLVYEQKIDGEWGCCHTAEEIAAGVCDDIDPDSIPALRHLAAIDSDHPDYDQRWKP